MRLQSTACLPDTQLRMPRCSPCAGLWFIVMLVSYADRKQLQLCEAGPGAAPTDLEADEETKGTSWSLVADLKEAVSFPGSCWRPAQNAWGWQGNEGYALAAWSLCRAFGKQAVENLFVIIILFFFFFLIPRRQINSERALWEHLHMSFKYPKYDTGALLRNNYILKRWSRNRVFQKTFNMKSFGTSIEYRFT